MFPIARELGFTLRGDFGLEIYNAQALSLIHISLRRLLIGLAENMRGFPCNTKHKEASACA